jgi:hypothetical protein
MAEVHLEDNVYNRQLAPDETKFKIWSSAGLMLTYWCSSRCACCYVFSSPKSGSQATNMSVDLALECWRGIRRLAGARSKVHITGGEPWGDFSRLERLLQAACEEGLEGLEKIETNAYWCTNEHLVRERLTRLRDLGLTKLQISTDVYHQEFVPLERVQLAVKVAQEILGPQGVQIRWRDFLADPVLVGPMNAPQRADSFRQAFSRRAERLLGRAAQELVSLFPLRDYVDFAEVNCKRNLLGAQHVHIDGAGNVFSGTCIGIITGKVVNGAPRPLDEIWRKFDYREHPIISVLVEQGPYGLLKLAQKFGYHRTEGYGSKCHLCYEVRKFLYERGEFLGYLGPGVCYGLPGD